MHRKHVEISEWNPIPPDEDSTVLREKSGFVLKYAQAMHFFNCYINYLCAEQPVVLFSEAFSKLN